MDDGGWMVDDGWWMMDDDSLFAEEQNHRDLPTWFSGDIL